jgi:arginine/lysine/ornithine decarboxylase
VKKENSGDAPLDQRSTPFLDSLLRGKQANYAAFHMPGHKRRLSVPPALEAYWGADLYAADLVEMGGVIDYLHAPHAALLEAQKLAAEAFGAQQTFFLINGSTVGNLAAMMSAARDGEKVIIPRASHRSVYSGLALSGAAPVYVEPMYHPQVGFPLAVDPGAVQSLFEAHPDAVALHVTSPNYYGYVSDVAGLACLAHNHDALLIVDEAHGSHFAFHPALPAPANRLGADMVVQSTHKTLGALTQASLLHCNGARVNLPRVAQVLGMLQSSSPSAILLASLDAARMQMAVDGKALLDRTLRLAAQARAEIRGIDGLWCYGEDLVGAYGIHAFDPTKLLIRVSDLGVSGFEAAHILQADYHLIVEFADLKHIVASITIADDDETTALLLTELRQLAGRRRPDVVSDEIAPPAGLPKAALSLREAYFAPSKRVPLDRVAGEICAEAVMPYPPGIPLLVPGEVIDSSILAYLRYLIAHGVNLVGPEDARVDYLRVIGRG